jgi:hypothetical protein
VSVVLLQVRRRPRHTWPAQRRIALVIYAISDRATECFITEQSVTQVISNIVSARILQLGATLYFQRERGASYGRLLRRGRGGFSGSPEPGLQAHERLLEKVEAEDGQ